MRKIKGYEQKKGSVRGVEAIIKEDRKEREREISEEQSFQVTLNEVINMRQGDGKI